jgi:predicted nucleic-acid-binding Zn-ribbon protein
MVATRMLGRDSSDSEDSETEFECAKCGGDSHDTAEIATAGSTMQKMLDVQSQKFDVVFCEECGYAEFYNKESSKLENVADLLTG